MPIAKELLKKCLALPTTERVELLETVGATLHDPEDEFPLPMWHLVELDRRVKELKKHPERSIPWSVVRQSLLRRLNARRAKAVRKG